MKKFSRILTVTLLLVAMVTAFAVVSLATDEEAVLEPKEVNSSTEKFVDGTFSGQTPGTVFQNALYNDKPKTGVWNVHSTEDGNVYIESEYEEGGSGAHDNLDMYFSYNPTYNMADYPYAVFDFDIMTENGTYGDYANLSISISNSGSRIQELSSTKLSAIGLDATPYKWQHVTYIVEHVGNGKFDHHFYINGEFSYKRTTDYSAYDAFTALNGDYSKMTVGYYRMYPSIYSGAASNGKIGYDNFRFSLFPDGYCEVNDGVTDFSKIATHYYDGTYELPYGLTVAKIGDAIYDDINEAIAAAGENDVITLVRNVDDVLLIDKNVTVDANIYEEGVATGNLYTYSFESTKCFIATETEEESGIFNYRRSPDAVDILWDVKCEGECDCYAEFGGHRLTATTSKLLGQIPEFFGTVPTWERTDALTQKMFLGWSYEDDGTVDELVAITEADVLAGSVRLYPVYKNLQYRVEVTSPAGAAEYHTAEDISKAFENAAAGSTVKLLDDVAVGAQIALKNKTVTIDLNGYTLSRQLATVTQYAATLGENGEYVKGDVLGDPISAGAAGYLFYINGLSSSYSITVKSSRPGAVLASVTVTADQWVYGGEVVKTENAKVTAGASIFSFYPVSGTVNVEGENLTVYCGNFIYGEHGGNGSEKININNGTYVIIGNPGEGVLALRNGEKITISNATFFCNGAELLRNTGGTSTGSSNRNKNTEVTFEDCKIYNAVLYTNATTDKYTFNNCILDAAVSGSNTGSVVIGKNTIMTKDLLTEYANASLAEGVESKTVSKRIYFDKSTKAEIVVDSGSLTPSSELTKNYTYLTYTVAAVATDTPTATVTWKDPAGNVIAVTEELSGVIAAAPKVAWSDSYRGVVNAGWVDAEGNATDLVIGDAESYEFTAVLPEEEDAVFVAYLTEVMMNMTYYAHFGYNLYLPVVDGVNVTSVGGKTPSAKVLVYGNEYYVVTVGYPDSTNALNDSSYSVKYTIDGVDYSVTVTVNAMLYAELAMKDANSTEVEKEAIASLVRYIEESYKLMASVDGSSLYTDNQDKFASFYANYRTPADYVTEYPEKELHTVAENAIGGLVESIHFTLAGSRVSFVVTLTDEAVAAGYKVFLSGIAYGVPNKNTAGNVYYTNNTPLHKYLMASTYVVTIVDAAGNTVVRDLDGDGVAETKAATNYSMATYVRAMEEKGVNVDIVKALYALGKAVLEVRDTVY